MPKKNETPAIGLREWVRVSLIRVTKAHFAFLLIYVVIIIAYDASKVITPDLVLDRWIAAALLLAAVSSIWYLAHNRADSLTALKLLTLGLISSDLAMAAFNVYTQRGMASRAVLLFVIPIIVSAILLSRSAIFATAALACAVYTSTAITYFTLHFNEGYKAELYGEIGFYSATFFVIAALLTALVRFGGSTNDS